MAEITATDAEAQLATLLDRVAGGETIIITRDGKPFAQLVPVTPFDPLRAKRAVEALRAWQATLPKTDITVDDILTARDEGRR